jgi:hypothetical protein
MSKNENLKDFSKICSLKNTCEHNDLVTKIIIPNLLLKNIFVNVNKKNYAIFCCQYIA